MKKIWLILYVIACIVVAFFAVKGFSDNIRQDKQDAILLERINQRTAQILNYQERLLVTEDRLRSVESRLSQAESRTKK